MYGILFQFQVRVVATDKALHFFDREAISTVQLLEDCHEWEVQYTCPPDKNAFPDFST